MSARPSPDMSATTIAWSASAQLATGPGEVEELMAQCRRLGKGRKRRHLGERVELRARRRLSGRHRERQGAYVALVIPAVLLLGEHALQPFTVQVEPLVLRAVSSGW